MRHQVNGDIVIDGRRRGDWVAMHRGPTMPFNDYHCVVTFYDEDNKPMFAEFIVRGVSETNTSLSLASRVLADAATKLKYVNEGDNK